MQKALLDWFRREQRDLPWRRNYEPYQVWISEIMLQQTQVATVLPYFERWMAALPTVQAVAEAEEELLLKLWEGLGYYSRARNIQKAARLMMEKHGGRLPTNVKDLLALPGVGPYTAGAIASIAFEQDEALVDGNVIRVLARWSGYEGNTRKNVSYFWDLARSLLPLGSARDFNQGLMELGALICTPKNPNCEGCPLASGCVAAQKGLQDRLPNRGPSKEKVRIKVVIGVMHKDGSVFIQKRGDSGLMAGLWEFPGGKVEDGEALEAALIREFREELRVNIGNLRYLMNIKHAYTKYLVDLHCFAVDFAGGELTLNSAVEGKWVKMAELSHFPFPAANVKLIKQLVS